MATVVDYDGILSGAPNWIGTRLRDTPALFPHCGSVIDHLLPRRPEIPTVAGSGAALPFPEGTFALVYCIAVLHHVAEEGAVRETLAEMSRVTRPGAEEDPVRAAAQLCAFLFEVIRLVLRERIPRRIAHDEIVGFPLRGDADASFERRIFGPDGTELAGLAWRTHRPGAE